MRHGELQEFRYRDGPEARLELPVGRRDVGEEDVAVRIWMERSDADLELPSGSRKLRALTCTGWARKVRIRRGYRSKPRSRSGNATATDPAALSSIAVASRSSATVPSCASLRPGTPVGISVGSGRCRRAIQGFTCQRRSKTSEPPRRAARVNDGLGQSTTVVVDRGRVIRRMSDTRPQPISA